MNLNVSHSFLFLVIIAYMDKLLSLQEMATVGLINKHFWKSKVGPLSAISIPLFLMILHIVIARSDSSVTANEIFTSGLPSYLSFSILPLCMISLPQMMVEFKTSIILRKISTSRITATKFSFLILAYNFTATILSTIFIFLLYALFLNKDAPDEFLNIRWGSLISSLLAIYFSGLAIGLFLGTFINKNNLVPILGFILLLISITFAGQFIPINVIYRADAIRYLSLFSPATYSLNQLNVVLLDSNKDFILNYPFINDDLANKIQTIKDYNFNGLFDLKNDFKIFNFSFALKENNFLTIYKISELIIYKNWQIVLNLIMPYVFGITFISLSIWKFKWTAR